MLKKYLFICFVLTFSPCTLSNDFYIDVRTPQEFHEINIPGTINIPHDQILIGVKEKNIQKDDSIYIFCRSGRRASNAQAILNTQGYSNVINLGGIADANKYIKDNNIELTK